MRGKQIGKEDLIKVTIIRLWSRNNVHQGQETFTTVQNVHPTYEDIDSDLVTARETSHPNSKNKANAVSGGVSADYRCLCVNHALIVTCLCSSWSFDREEHKQVRFRSEQKRKRHGRRSKKDGSKEVPCYRCEKPEHIKRNCRVGLPANSLWKERKVHKLKLQ